MINLKGVDFTLDLGGGDDEAIVYQDEGLINGGFGNDKVLFASINESNANVKKVIEQGITYYEVSDKSISMPKTLRLTDIEYIKFADQNVFSDIDTFVNNAPSFTDIFYQSSGGYWPFQENVPGGSIVGIVSAEDLDGDTLLFEITGGLTNLILK